MPGYWQMGLSLVLIFGALWLVVHLLIGVLNVKEVQENEPDEGTNEEF